MEQLRLTQFSPGAGCGCKISPNDLENILLPGKLYAEDPRLLVGNHTNDDAAVYDIGNGEAIISTTDFFTPIVDDPFSFGAIAAVNAISDVYAMGGKPLMAISILGWPLEKLSAEVARQVIEGARHICSKAGITLAGGHSIDIKDPVFGLSVTGKIEIQHLKQNNTAIPGCKLFLTKPLGVGILTTAQKNNILEDNDKNVAIDIMLQLNKIGTEICKLPQVKALTDVTGFGLLGHLLEMCESSNVNATIEFNKIPKIPQIDKYIEKECFPGGTFRNWKSYGNKVSEIPKEKYAILADPQTSGGLLIAVEEDKTIELMQIAENHKIELQEFGTLSERNVDDEKYIDVI